MSIKNYINCNYLFLFMASVVNLLFMHYQILLTISLESECFKSSPFDNLIACLLDVTILFLLSMLITWKKHKLSLVITFIITLLWSFCNVFYSRFFQQYLSLSSIGQAGNLTDDVVINSMLAGFKPIDVYYPLMLVVFFVVFRKVKQNDLGSKSVKSTIFLWLLCLSMGLAVHSIYCFHPEMTFTYQLRKTIFTPTLYNSLWPNWTVFHKGSFRTLILDNIGRDSVLDLSQEQTDMIEKELNDNSQRIIRETLPHNIKNVIFIIVESYLASSSDLVIGGKEITPNLNRLKRDSNVYYNGHMHPNVATGESSDGQFIYMTGLLPLRSEITVSKVKHNTLLGLPKLLKKKYPNMNCQMIIPTNPTLWEQQAMSESYGFDVLYSKQDYKREMNEEKSDDLSDEKIFAYASKKDQGLTSPFFLMILSMSMHHPYNSCVEHGFQISDNTIPEKYKNYLTTCHYTDIQIGKYLQHLKEKGIYDNSMIIIVSDHDAHLKFLDMEGKIAPDLPFYIVNGGINKEDAWHGECNQLDVYTTILDIMGIESKWRGLGHTLLNKKYEFSVTDKTQELSDWINYSNFFSKNK